MESLALPSALHDIELSMISKRQRPQMDVPRHVIVGEADSKSDSAPPRPKALAMRSLGTST